MAVGVQVTSLNNLEPHADSSCDQAFISFGRSKSCTYILSHPEVSRRHFTIRFDKEKYFILDEDSKFGTILDGEKLDLGKMVFLEKSHQIRIPGFKININIDGAKPNIEKTQVVARKIMGELLQNNLDTNYESFVPRLECKEKNLFFEFDLEKSVFVLGSDDQAEFYINSNLVNKQHLKFSRDLNGIVISMINNSESWVNNKLLEKPILLRHQDTVMVGGVDLIYFERKYECQKTESRKANYTKPETKEKYVKYSRIFLDIIFAAIFLGSVTGLIIIAKSFYF